MTAPAFASASASSPAPAPPDERPRPRHAPLSPTDYPRGIWQAHPHFAGLTAFRPDGHLTLRHLPELLNTKTESLLNGECASNRPTATTRPRIILFSDPASQPPKIARGFNLMEAGHMQLDPALAGFAEAANLTLGKLAEGEHLKVSTASCAASLESLGKLHGHRLTARRS